MARGALTLVMISALAQSACIVHSTYEVTDLPRMLREPTSDALGLEERSRKGPVWVWTRELVVVDDTICVRSMGPACRGVPRIMIVDVPVEDEPGILKDLPPAVRVTSPYGNVIYLETGGHDLTPWLQSAAHAPDDRAVPRYYLMLGGAWRGPLTWSELTSARTMGWPIASTKVRARKVNKVASALVTTGVIVTLSLVLIFGWDDILESLIDKADIDPPGGGPE